MPTMSAQEKEQKRQRLAAMLSADQAAARALEKTPELTIFPNPDSSEEQQLVVNELAKLERERALSTTTTPRGSTSVSPSSSQPASPTASGKPSFTSNIVAIPTITPESTSTRSSKTEQPKAKPISSPPKTEIKTLPASLKLFHRLKKDRTNNLSLWLEQELTSITTPTVVELKKTLTTAINIYISNRLAIFGITAETTLDSAIKALKKREGTSAYARPNKDSWIPIFFNAKETAMRLTACQTLLNNFQFSCNKEQILNDLTETLNDTNSGNADLNSFLNSAHAQVSKLQPTPVQLAPTTCRASTFSAGFRQSIHTQLSADHDALKSSEQKATIEARKYTPVTLSF